MTNQIATVSLSDSFKIARTSKSGKVTERNLLGLIIEGTADERLESGILLAKEAWENGRYLVVLETLSRVFAGSTWTASCIFCKLDEKNPNRDAMVALMDALTRFHAESKGVKAKYVKLCAQLVEWSKAEAERKEARRLAYEESLKTVNAA